MRSYQKNLKLYGGEMLAEEYIPGREFTVVSLKRGNLTRLRADGDRLYPRDAGDYHVYSYKVKQEYQNTYATTALRT